MESGHKCFDEFIESVRILFDTVIVPGMQARTIRVDLRPIDSGPAGARRIAMAITPLALPSGHLAEARARLAVQVSDAFLLDVAPFGRVDLSQQNPANVSAVEIRFFTDAPGNEFLERVRRVNASLERPAGKSR